MVKNITESLNNILQILEGCCTDAGGDIHIDPKNLGIFEVETTYLQERMGLTPFQSILLAVIIQLPSSRCSIRNVGDRVGMSYLGILSYASEFYALRDKGLIRLSRDNNIKVPAMVLESLMKDTPYQKPKYEGLTPKGLFRRIGILMQLITREESQSDQILEEIEYLIAANKELPFVKGVDKYLSSPKISLPERFLFFVLAHLYVNRDYNEFDAGDIEPYFSDEDQYNEVKCRFEGDSLELMAAGILGYSDFEGLIPMGSYSFKSEVIEDLFADVKKPSANKLIDLTDCMSKPEKQLYYNPKEQEQIDKLADLLNPDNLHDVFLKMKSLGLRTGFACLFYGAPGTGKTETVYQIARKTGRKILQADVAKLRNCYVGETEKNVRQLFRDYEIAKGENDLSPILLFNEADAILGTRMEGASRAVDRMENSVQNILLQEMEDFEGIMIATTNLTCNLDPAFERRFLYKIRFDKPGIEPRSKIWQSQFPFLSEQEALSLAEGFNLSGGQIENVVRKLTIDGLLSSKDPSYDSICICCQEENIEKNTRIKIGY